MSLQKSDAAHVEWQFSSAISTNVKENVIVSMYIAAHCKFSYYYYCNKNANSLVWHGTVTVTIRCNVIYCVRMEMLYVEYVIDIDFIMSLQCLVWDDDFE